MDTVKSALMWLLNVVLPHHAARERTDGMSVEAFIERAERNSLLLPDHVVAPLRYKDPLVRSAIHAVKYHKSRHAATLLAHAIYPYLIEELSDAHVFTQNGTPLLVPIPLSRERLRIRGGNQSIVVAESLVAIDRERSFLLIGDALVRTRDTTSQTSLPRKKRIENVRGAFRVVNALAVKGKTIIVLDDVTTTGATLGDAKRALLEAGARAVIAVAAAH